MFTANQLSEKVNRYLKELSYSRKPEGLYSPIQYVLSLGGKRIRPTLMLMAYELYKGNVDKILDQAVGIEIYHNFTLLHDDLMDCADKRRGNPTVHIKWNNNTAILSGDAMTVLAYQYLSTCDNTKLPQVMKIFNDTALEICEGQEWDMEFESRDNVTDKEYIEMIRLKTAVLLAGSLKIGAVLAGASEEDAAQLYQFGIEIGLAFQLQDDFLDVYGNTANFGKNIGGDILCNKKTYMLIKALSLANEKQLDELNKWLSATQFDPQEKIKAVTKLYDELNIASYCDKMIEDYYNRGIECLRRVSVGEEKKLNLITYAQELMHRKV
jgi:geranylgeranyl diphosphate synthase type II